MAGTCRLTHCTPRRYVASCMLRVVQLSSAAERITAAVDFIRSFAAATELLLVGSSREAVDDLVRGFARTSGATFGLHRFSFTQLASRLATPKLAVDGLAPATSLGNDAVAARAVYEALENGELAYFSPVARFPGFARASASTLSELRSASVEADELQRLEAPAGDNAALLNEFEEQVPVWPSVEGGLDRSCRDSAKREVRQRLARNPK